MIDGLWTGEWKSNVSHIENHTAGVFILDSGKISGGNTKFYYLGSYEIIGNEIKGEMEFTHFSGDPIGILGLFKNGLLTFKGQFSDSEMKFVITMKESATVRIIGVLIKRMDLGGKADAP